MGTYYVVKGNATAAAPYTTMYTAAADLDTAVAYFQASGTENSTILIADSETHTTGATEAGALPFDLIIKPSPLQSPVFGANINLTNTSNGGITIEGLEFDFDSGSAQITVAGAIGNTCTIKNCIFKTISSARAIDVAIYRGTINIQNNLFIQCKYGIEDTGAVARNITIANNTFYSTVSGTGHIALADSGATVAIKNNIFYNGVYSVYANDTGVVTTVNCNYNCHYNITNLYLGNVTIGGKVGEITTDPLFQNIYGLNFKLKRTSPCIDTGNPSDSADAEAYGGCGRINMGRYGGTKDAAIASWCRPIGYGNQYGNYYGGFIANEYFNIVPDVTNSWIAFTINGQDVAWVDLLGTSVATCFVNSEPTGARTAATSVGIRFNETSHYVEFYRNGSRVCYTKSTGAAFG